MNKTIHWYDKRGKGSYFDPKLNHFINLPCHGSDEEVRLAEEVSHVSTIQRMIKKLRFLKKRGRLMIALKLKMLSSKYKIAAWYFKKTGKL